MTLPSAIANNRPTMGMTFALWCVTMLLAFTISPPEDYKVRAAGTKSILPPKVIKVGKLASRGLSYALVCFYLVQLVAKARFARAIVGVLPIVLFAGWGITSTFWSADRTTSLMQSGTFTLLVMLALTIGLSWRSQEDTSRLLFRASFVLMLLAFLLIVLRFAAPHYGALTKQSSGIFHSTAAGATSSLAIVVMLLSVLIWEWRWSKQLLVPALSAHIAVLLIAGNRLSMILTVVLGGLTTVTLLAKQRLAVMAVTVGVLGMVYFMVDPRLELLRESVTEVGDFAAQGQSRKSLESFSGRTEMWEIMWRSYLESPIIGHGYFVTSERGEIYVWYEWGNWTAHNWFLQLVATTGAVGAILLIGGIIWTASGVYRCRRVDPSIARFLMVVLFWYLGWGLLNSSYLGPMQPESVLIAICLGLAVSMFVRDEPEITAGQLP